MLPSLEENWTMVKLPSRDLTQEWPCWGFITKTRTHMYSVGSDETAVRISRKFLGIIQQFDLFQLYCRSDDLQNQMHRQKVSEKKLCMKCTDVAQFTNLAVVLFSLENVCFGFYSSLKKQQQQPNLLVHRWLLAVALTPLCSIKTTTEVVTLKLSFFLSFLFQVLQLFQGWSYVSPY